MNQKWYIPVSNYPGSNLWIFLVNASKFVDKESSMPETAQEVLKMIQDQDIELIDLKFVDTRVSGTARSTAA